MSNDLYYQELMDLASLPVGTDPIYNPNKSIKVFNPSCGDVVSIQIRIDQNILNLAAQVKGCAICTASAAKMCQLLNEKEIKFAASTIKLVSNILHHNSKPKSFDELNIFTQIAKYPNRHNCAWLPWEGLLKLLN